MLCTRKQHRQPETIIGDRTTRHQPCTGISSVMRKLPEFKTRYGPAIGATYEKLDRLDSARLFTQQGYELAVRMNDLDDRGVALNNLGNIYAKLGQNDVAMEHYRHSLPYLESENDDDVICEATLGMAGLFKNAGQADSALHYAHRSLAVAERSRFTKRVLSASNFLSAFYEGIHLVDSAYTYQKMKITSKDYLFNKAKNKVVQNLGFTQQIHKQ